MALWLINRARVWLRSNAGAVCSCLNQRLAALQVVDEGAGAGLDDEDFNVQTVAQDQRVLLPVQVNPGQRCVLLMGRPDRDHGEGRGQQVEGGVKFDGQLAQGLRISERCADLFMAQRLGVGRVISEGAQAFQSRDIGQIRHAARRFEAFDERPQNRGRNP